MKNHIVLARYMEPSRTEDYRKLSSELDAELFVYRKGRPLGADEIELENVGRESHTFLHHICEHYYTVEDSGIYLFSQYDFDGMSPWADLNRYFSKMISAASAFGASGAYVRVNERIDGHPFTKLSGPNFAMCISSAFEKAQIAVPSTLVYPATAAFALRGDVLRRLPLEKARKLRDWTAEEGNPKFTPNRAHAMERAWFYVFGLAGSTICAIDFNDANDRHVIKRFACVDVVV